MGLPSPAGAAAGYGDVSEGTWYTDAVQWSVDNGIADIAGFCFGPETPVSRGETAVWFYNMANQPDAGDRHSFTDVTDASQNDAISWMADTGITTGTSPSTFAPDETLTRAEVATFLHRLAGKPEAPPHNFVDVVTAWQQDGVSWMAHTGITTGTSATTFDPEGTLTRAQLVTFLWRYQNEPPVTIDATTPHCDPTAETAEDPADSDPPPDTTTTIDSDENTEIEQDSEDYKAVTGLYSWAFTSGKGSLRGDHPVHVFYCARQGKYTTEDLREVVDLLNNEVSPRWTKESSGLFTFVFTEGSIISPDLPWNDVDLETAYKHCASSTVFTGPDPEQVLLLVDTAPRKNDGYGSHRRAISVTRELLGTQRFLSVVAHELGHSLPGLRHDFVRCPGGTLMRGTETQYCEAGGAILGEWSPIPYGGGGLALSCHHRRLLGWPVGGDSTPCALQPPSRPSLSWSSVDNDGFTVIWTPPIFTDDVPVDGYTLIVVQDGTVYEQHEVSADDRSITIDGLPIGHYSARLWAESEYGSGVPFRIGTLPITPSPVSVRATAINSTAFRVSWSAVSGATHYLVSDSVSGENSPDGVEIHEGGISRSYGGTPVRDGTSLVLQYRQPDTEYTVTVRACGFEDVFGSEECNLIGTEVTFTTKTPEPTGTAPGPVPSVSITDAGDDWLALSWDPVPGATYYECGYLTSRNTWQVGPGTTHTSCALWWDTQRAADIGLVAGTTYTVGVTACQEPMVMCSEWTTATASTQLLASAPVSYPVAVKEVGDTWFTLSWDPSADDAFYDLRVVTGPSRWLWRRGSQETPDVTVGQLQPNTDYIIKVRTCGVNRLGLNCSSWVTIPVSTSSGN